ncbi:MAG: Csa1 family protein [Sarcina sp.]
MTQIIGCTDSEKERMILGKFNDFLTMFPSEDLTFLFDKEGEVSSVTGESLVSQGGSELENGDLGSWRITSYVNTRQEADKPISVFGIVLGFDKNSNRAGGNLVFRKGDREELYPIYYDEGKLHLVEEDAPKYIKDGLSKFKIMYDFIELDKEYIINDLKNTSLMHNLNAPIFNAHYKLENDEKNILKIKEVYPDLPMNEDDYSLVLEGNGTPWNVRSSVSLEIILDKESSTTLTSSMTFY